MEASSITQRALRYARVREWAWWQLPLPLRVYVGAMPLAALAVIAYTTAHTTWQLDDIGKFILLLTCGLDRKSVV